MRLSTSNFLSFVFARWRLALLIVVTTLVWVAQYDRWTLTSWSVPTDYSGDALEILARIKAAAEGDTVPLTPQVITRLGAPFGANWSAYPSSDLLLLWTLGRLARVVGVYAAANVALLLATLTAALAFYGCARWLRSRWEWAFAGAVLFAFTFQTFHRGLPHLFIVFAWTVPCAVLSCGLVAASRRLRLRNGLGVFCLLTGAAIGVGNPYTLMLYLQLVGWALVAQWLGPRRRENIITGLAAMAAAILGFVLVESHVWLYATDSAATSPVVRNYGGTERYALKPIELLLPPATHRWEPLGFLGQRYVRWSDWRSGESFAPYLGLVGIAAFLWLSAVSLRAVLRRERLPGLALPTAWVLAFASMGGVTNMLAFFTSITVFRATNRFSIFISAIVLLFLVLRLGRWRPRAAWLSVAAAAAVIAVGLLDQLPRPPDPARQQRVAQRVQADLELGGRMERILPVGGMVFQLPVIGFPEVVPPFRLADYEHFRPYLGTQTLRFTYGAMKGRCRGQWQRDLAKLPTAELARRLEQLGFSAIYLNRLGFGDDGEKVLGELASAGYTQRLESNLRQQVVVLLHPSPTPERPVARSLTFGQGWHEAQPGEPRWAYGPAALSFFNPQDRPLTCRVRLVASAIDHRRVSVRLNGQPVAEAQLDGTQRETELELTMQAGVNRIDFDSAQPPVRLSMGRDQLRSFALYSTAVQPL